MAKTTKNAKEGLMKLTGKSYANVTQMVQGTADDPAFAEDFKKSLCERQLIRRLVALRCAQGLSQCEIGERMGYTQSKVSKMEASVDAEIALGDFSRYLHALGRNMRIVIAPEGSTGADHVRFFASSIMRELDRLVALAGDDQAIGDGVGLLAIKTVMDLVVAMRRSIEMLPRRQDSPPKSVVIEVEGNAGEEQALDSVAPSRKRKERLAGAV